MKEAIAQQRYQQRYIEAGLPRLSCDGALWQYALVIPAYRESPRLLQTLTRLALRTEPFLAVLVLNRPDSDRDKQANSELRAALQALPENPHGDDQVRLLALGNGSSLVTCDTEIERGPLPADRGVGLARKIGCDLAWQWIRDGAIASDWIFSSDADARLPADYFRRLVSCETASVAATYPFFHVPGPDPACNEATALYELRLHHYVLGLEFAGSPYAHHTLGSSLAIKADAYAKVRGFPQRAGGEDFYLLNKLRKLGPIHRLQGQCIELASRQSHRVPFGTGPAVARIADSVQSPALFYHPRCFSALQAVLAAIAQGVPGTTQQLVASLRSQALSPALSRDCAAALGALGWQAAMEHCQRQAGNHGSFLRHFHQWFDAFRTLKLIHALRDAGLPQQTIESLESMEPRLWPAGYPSATPLEAVHRHWNWTRDCP